MGNGNDGAEVRAKLAALRAACDTGEISEFEYGKKAREVFNASTQYSTGGNSNIVPFIGRPGGTIVAAGITAILAIFCSIFALAGAGGAAVGAAIFWTLSFGLGFWAFLALLFHKIELRLIEIQKSLGTPRAE